ncbi:uncharacterized protein LOC128259603 isoform X1 [Drosophila gunungcola]|uniref:uncharacterized protein LOC128259603 isoform X1 n=1 Tax=Drosophila gunungcola TaxID=103775 RepID=UPI0022E81125|nr:uncharacterized protein LOC128259603 isoform X1 [Drosophila gunungcola]
MKLLGWETLGCSMANILPKPLYWSGPPTTLSLFNQSQEQMVEGSTGCCCSLDWLLQLQQLSCPLLRLLILGLVALPIYNAILILVGWRLNRSASSSAERLVLDIRVERAVKRPAPPPPPAPKPPPRLRRRKASKSPKLHCSVRMPASYPSQKNPFDSNWQRSRDQAHHYNNLRKNLQLALEGLQKPLPPSLPICIAPIEESLSPQEPLLPPASVRIKSRKSRSKLLPGIFKRLGMNSIWQGWKARGSRKKCNTSEAPGTSSSSCSSTGSSCFYVY